MEELSKVNLVSIVNKVATEQDVMVIGAYLVGSRHWGVNRPESDYDIVAVYIEHPAYSLLQNRRMNNRISTIWSDDCEIKFISLTEFMRQIKRCSFAAAEPLFCGTELIGTYTGLFQETFEEMLDERELAASLVGAVIKDLKGYQTKNFNCKALSITFKWLAIAYAVSRKVNGFRDSNSFKDLFDLQTIWLDPTLPEFMVKFYNDYILTGRYYDEADPEARGLAGEALLWLKENEIDKFPSNRNRWDPEVWETVDNEIDRKTIKIHADFFESEKQLPCSKTFEQVIQKLQQQSFGTKA